MQLSIPSELGHVRFLGVALRAVLVELGHSEEQISSVELCLVEAVNNVIEHAYREEPGHLVEVELCADADELELTVSDVGVAMPEDALARAQAREAELAAADDAEPGDLGAAFDLGAVPEGGYGLRLITQVMSEVDYRRDGDRNKLTMMIRGPRKDVHAARS